MKIAKAWAVAIATPKDFRPIKDGYMLQFDGNDWVVAGELLRGD
jgi:hypothetical protein